MDVEALRRQIPATQRTVYMNTGWSGPSPTSVVEAVTKRQEYEKYSGPTIREVLDSGREIKLRAREAVAGLLNATLDEVCLTQNTTHGLALVLAGLPWQPGDEIITFDLEHPSVYMSALHVQRRQKAKVVVLPLAPDEGAESIVAKVQEALTERTRLLFFSHIQYSSGLRMPLEALRRLTRPYNIWMLVDGAQTAGHIALDMRALDCDFYAIPGQKWLLGPEGIGALYIRREAIPLVEPVLVSGQAFAGRESAGEIRLQEELITKFNLSTSSAPLAAGMLEAVRFIQGVGMAEIEERDRSLAHTFKTRLTDLPGFTVHSPFDPAASSGLVTFGMEGIDPPDAVARLWERHRIVARQVSNPSGVRLSLDFFNTEEEVERVVEALQRIREAGR